MESYLAEVEDTFMISGRGLVVAPGFPEKDYVFEKHEKLRIETPEGNTFECEALFQIPFQTPRAKILLYHCMLQNVAKESVPLKSQIWILGKNENEFRK
ncbi:hypothetical protein [Teredinibacter purpureus]|uniref:hypothetical protein n=1 Tax=Teredinibacter purpureus TaxID=2731756 RepID=UPI0005F76980|nr:hypothetical protein [Teredinibacter purpureus]